MYDKLHQPCQPPFTRRAGRIGHWRGVGGVRNGFGGCSSGPCSISVTLLERYGFAGGTPTQMLDTFCGFFTPGETPRRIVSGWPDRIVNELNKTGSVFPRPTPTETKRA